MNHMEELSLQLPWTVHLSDKRPVLSVCLKTTIISLKHINHDNSKQFHVTQIKISKNVSNTVLKLSSSRIAQPQQQHQKRRRWMSSVIM